MNLLEEYSWSDPISFHFSFSCVLVFLGTWIDKGLGMISGGFIPSPLHHVTEYVPSFHELIISAGVTAIGMLALTILYKITISVKEEGMG